MLLKVICLDASIILALLLNDSGKNLSEFCEKVLRDAQKNQIVLIAPDFLKIELANVLVQRVKNSELQNEYLSRCAKLKIDYYAFDYKKLAFVAELAHEKQVSVYDTLYYYLALCQNATLYTADKRFFNRVKDFGSIELVQ